MNINNQLLAELNNKLEFLIIGHNSTSYKLPLIVECVKEYEGKICLECKNIKGKYLVFDKTTFLKEVENFNNNNK